MSDSAKRTPRTDASICQRIHTPNVFGFKEHDRVDEFVRAAFARTLERESDARGDALLQVAEYARQIERSLRNLVNCVERDQGNGGILLPTDAALASAKEKLISRPNVPELGG